jgi:hypothetical protein
MQPPEAPPKRQPVQENNNGKKTMVPMDSCAIISVHPTAGQEVHGASSYHFMAVIKHKTAIA